MTKKLIVCILIAFSLIFIFLLSQFGSNPFGDDIVQAKSVEFSSDQIKFGTGANSDKLYYELPCLNDNETIYMDLSNFVKLDPNATMQKEQLRYSIIFDNPDEADNLSLALDGLLAGKLTISGQASAIITVKTTDGSNLEATLYVIKNQKGIEEHNPGDIFD